MAGVQHTEQFRLRQTGAVQGFPCCPHTRARHGRQSSTAARAGFLTGFSLHTCAQAAVYGRAFVPADAFPKDGIITVARKLRILNALREPSVWVLSTCYFGVSCGEAALLAQ